MKIEVFCSDGNGFAGKSQEYIDAVEKLSFGTRGNILGNVQNIRNAEKYLSEVYDPIPRNYCFVLENKNNSPIGVATVHTKPRMTDNSDVVVFEFCVYVHTAYRRQGFAKQLHEAALHYLLNLFTDHPNLGNQLAVMYHVSTAGFKAIYRISSAIGTKRIFPICRRKPKPMYDLGREQIVVYYEFDGVNKTLKPTSVASSLDGVLNTVPLKKKIKIYENDANT